MTLKRVEISGFKSFAKKGVLEFKTPITAIVGPNGSGKSNVAEAFSFVLGEQSMKSLRGKRGEDLIFNGSKTISKSNRAAVKVVFDNTNKFLSIDFDEVVVERVVHRDATNDYLINGSKVRLKDVVELLAGANIGPSGHHIISQGEADRVLNVNPKERRSIVEDALGLKVFQIKKRDSERRLEKTEDNLKEIKSLRREIKPHLNFLEKQVSKIEKTIELKKELTDLYLNYFSIENSYLNNQKKYLENEAKIPKQRLRELHEELEKAQMRFKNSKDATGEKDEKEKKELIHKELNKLEEDKQNLILEEGRLEGELNSLLKIIDKGEKSENEGGVSLGRIKDFTSDLLTEIDNAIKLEDLSRIRDSFNEIKKKINNFLGISGEIKINTYDEEKERIKELKSLISEIRFKKEQITKELESLQSKFNDIQSSFISSKGESLEAEKEVYRIQSDLNKLEGEVREIEDMERRLEHDELDFKKEVGEAGAIIGRTVLTYMDIEVFEDIKDREAQREKLQKIQKIKVRIEESGGASGEEIIKEYEEVKERDAFLEKELDDLEKTKNSLKGLVIDLEKELENRFKDGLVKINEQFQDFFALMFGGGHASLKVVKERILNDEGLEKEQEVIEGLDIDISLPRKQVKGLIMLSGGERALTSIALIFAMSQVNPPPFIILDETDAALDEANSRRYGDMIENLAKHSELILITHNRETMSRAGVLYGVTMGSDGVSRLLSVDLEEAVEVAK